MNLFSYVDIVVQMRNAPHSFMCLSTWLPDGDIVWEGMEPVRGGAWLEKVHNWRLTLKAYSAFRFFLPASWLWLQCNQWSQVPDTPSLMQ